MKPHRLLYINPFAQEISGPDESLLLLLSGLDRARYTPLVWLPPGSPLAKRYRELNVSLIEHPVPAIRRSLSPNFWWQFYRQTLQSAEFLKRLIQQESIDLVHSNMEVLLFPGMACRSTLTPCIYHVRGTSFYKPAWVGRILVNFMLSHSDAIFCISDAVRKFFPVETSRLVETLYNPVALDSNREANDWHPPLKKPIWIGAAGRINSRKDFASFIQAAAQIRQHHPEVGFMIVGATANDEEERYLAALKALVTQFNLNDTVIFTGRITPMRLAYEQMHCCCLLSHSEGFGRVLAEAAAMGLPTIGTNIDGIRELIDDHQTGWLIPAQPATAKIAGLVQAIEEFLADRPLAKRYGEAARRKVQSSFSLQAHLQQIEAVYEKLLTPKPVLRQAV